MDILDKYEIPIWPDPAPHVDIEDAKLGMGSALFKNFIVTYPEYHNAQSIKPEILRRFLERVRV